MGNGLFAFKYCLIRLTMFETFGYSVKIPATKCSRTYESRLLNDFAPDYVSRAFLFFQRYNFNQLCHS